MGRQYKVFLVTRKIIENGSIVINQKEVKVYCDQVSKKKNCKVSHNPCIFNDYNTTLLPENYRKCIYYKNPKVKSHTNKNFTITRTIKHYPENIFDRYPNAKIVPSSIDKTNTIKNDNKNSKNKKKSFEQIAEDKSKKELERKLNLYKPKPCYHLVDVSNHTSNKTNIRTNHASRMWYDDPSLTWIKANWVKTDKEIKIVHVFQTFLYCSKNKHNLSFYKATVKDLKNEYRSHEANIIYCNDCERYYIDSTQYRNIRKLGILPNFKVYPLESASNEFSSFKKESKLSLYGYNAQKNTPVSYRQRILYDVINNNLMNTYDVISHLQGLISLAELRSNMDEVIDRYKSDILYIIKTFPGEDHGYYITDFY